MTRILEQTLWLIETGENENRTKRIKKEDGWKVVCNQMWTRCRAGKTSALLCAITVVMVVAETFRTEKDFAVVSVFPSLAITVDCLFHTVRITMSFHRPAPPEDSGHDDAARST